MGFLLALIEKLLFFVGYVGGGSFPKPLSAKEEREYTELMQKKRLAQAAFYLSDTDIKINDVCEFVGYDNTSYFYKIFREKYL